MMFIKMSPMTLSSSANKEIAKARMNYEKEIAVLKAKVTKHELTIKGLEATVEQKSKENKELMSICDELIQKIDAK